MKPYQDDDDPTPPQTVREWIGDDLILVAFFVALTTMAIVLAAIFMYGAKP